MTTSLPHAVTSPAVPAAAVGGAFLFTPGTPLQVVPPVASAPSVNVEPQAAPQSPRVRAGSAVSPDTVTVADPFTLTVAVEIPVDATVVWPSPDSTARVALRSPLTIRQDSIGDARQVTAVYRLAAWDTGTVSLGLPDVVIHLADSRTIRVPVDARVYVRSVLPGDTSLRVPRPQRPLFPRTPPWWQEWWPVLLVALCTALVLALARRRKRDQSRHHSAEVPDPYDRALRDFARLERMGLADAGESGQYVAVAIDILRTYLAARLPVVAPSQTSSEILNALNGSGVVPIDRLAPLLAESDTVKFSRTRISPDRARWLGGEARSITETIEEMSNRDVSSPGSRES